MLLFSTEPYELLEREIYETFSKVHYDELATMKAHIPRVDYDFDLYRLLDSAGKLHLVTARFGNTLAGYFLGIVTGHPHYKSTLTASADLYYLAPEYRKWHNGLLFLQFIENSLKERGAQLLVVGTKLSRDLGKVYEFLGYEETDRVFRKWIGG
jgi:hypothetical protein